VVGGYRLLRPLGEGGMGTVFESVTASGQHVAVKPIAPDFADSPETVERFRPQEGKLASTIAHPRCVFVLAADEEPSPGGNVADAAVSDGSRRLC
jgi:serine/threonine protein kinase